MIQELTTYWKQVWGHEPESYWSLQMSSWQIPSQILFASFVALPDTNSTKDFGIHVQSEDASRWIAGKPEKLAVWIFFQPGLDRNSISQISWEFDSGRTVQFCTEWPGISGKPQKFDFWVPLQPACGQAWISSRPTDTDLWWSLWSKFGGGSLPTASSSEVWTQLQSTPWANSSQ